MHPNITYSIIHVLYSLFVEPFFDTYDVYGLGDISMAKAPEPAELSGDISVTEMKATFSNAFWNHFILATLKLGCYLICV